MDDGLTNQGRARRTPIENLLRQRYGSSIRRFVHYPSVQQVAVHFTNGRRQLFDRDGTALGRET